MSSKGLDSKDEASKGSQVQNTYKKKKHEGSMQQNPNKTNKIINNNIMFNEINKQPSEKVLIQTMMTIPDETEIAKETKINNDYHVTDEIEIDKTYEEQLGNKNEKKLTNSQMSYSEMVKKSLLQTRERRNSEKLIHNGQNKLWKK
ncbi:hypothetical protein C2G38_2181935 [Gigaspora rosea]|uniref:Uncharacterized protein n=1 Tax=Gigaspora rosea TaxID=44941 RepID=A0A397VBK1_9GLOM|nr:hypothetical protein C2G38_2181935 [Gigaspora rosea]